MEQTILMIVSYAAVAFRWLIFIYIISSWIPPFRDSKFGMLVERIVDPYLALFRKVIPPLGGIDFSPIVAIFVYNLLVHYAIDGLATFIDLVQKYV